MNSRDGTLVDSEMIANAMTAISGQGADKALAELATYEHDLAAFIAHGATNIAGKLSLSGAPGEVVRGSHEDFLTVVLTCIRALKRGHYELWKDTQVGSRLAQIDPGLAPQPRRRKVARGSSGVLSKQEDRTPKHETNGTSDEA